MVKCPDPEGNISTLGHNGILHRHNNEIFVGTREYTIGPMVAMCHIITPRSRRASSRKSHTRSHRHEMGRASTTFLQAIAPHDTISAAGF
jgi:hypothetical protein